MPYKFLNELPMDDLQGRKFLTEEEKLNEIEILNMQKKYLYAADDEGVGNGEDKNRKWASKEDRIKYWKIYFLGNMGQADKDYRNEGFSFKGSHTMIPSPYSGIGVVEAEKYLMKNKWRLEYAYEQIRGDKGIETKFPFIKINFVEFCNLFDEKKRKGMNKIVYAMIALIIIFLIYTLMVHPKFLVDWAKHIHF